jgi:LCP family protein required for cell wall assembly
MPENYGPYQGVTKPIPSRESALPASAITQEENGRPAVQSVDQPSLLNRNLASNRPLLASNDRDQKRLLRHKGHRLRRWSFRASLAIVTAVVVMGGFLVIKGYIKLHEVFHGGGTAAALQANVNPDQLKTEGDGRVNILILGIGGAGHDGPDLTDTMLLASIDPVNNKADLLSVPRDLWVKMPNNYIANYQKINAAYESGKYKFLGTEDSSNSNQQAVEAGFKAVDGVVSNVLGIPIDYNVLVDFQAFQQAVDTVGGVTLDVPTELYDPTMAWENNWNPVLAMPGVQTMNGAQALNYARSRETTSDFARTQRQRAILLALKQKVLTLGTLSNPLKISSLISDFGDNVRTDISLSDAEALYGLMQKISNSDIQSIGLADPPNNYVTTGAIDGLSVVEPTAGEFNYSQIQSYVRNTLRDGYLAKENANIEVLNGTNVPGLSNKVAATLKSYGYNVGYVGDAPTTDYQQTIIVDLTNGRDKYTSNYLQNRFGVKTVSSLPDKSITPGNAQFVIIVGQNEANTN